MQNRRVLIQIVLALAVLVLLCASGAGGAFIYWTVGQQAFTTGSQAFDASNYPQAVDSLDQAATLFRYANTANLPAAQGMLEQGSLLLLVDSALRAENYETAVLADLAYIEIYPDGDKYEEAVDGVVDNLRQWSQNLRQDGQFAPAFEKTEFILAAYPEHPRSSEVRGDASDLLLAWAADLRQKGDFDGAIHKYYQIINDFQDSEAALQASNETAAAYAEWGDALTKAGHFEDALLRYWALLSEYGNSPSAASGVDKMAQTTLDWADQMAKSGDTEGAIAKYNLVISQYFATSAARAAAAKIADLTLEWSNKLLEEKDYAGAIAKFEQVQQCCAGSSSALSATEAIASATLAWADALLKAGDYKSAIEKYEKILTFGGGDSAINDQLAAAYQGWADKLYSDADYAGAIRFYQLILTRYPDSTAAKTAADQAAAAYDWASSQRKEHPDIAITLYQAVLEQYPHSPGADKARADLPSALLEAAVQFAKAKDYPQALAFYDSLRRGYPGSREAETALPLIPGLTLDWAKQLLDSRLFTRSMQVYNQVKEVSSDKDLLQTAADGYAAALLGLARDKGGEGTLLVQQIYKNACAMMPSAFPVMGIAKGDPLRALICPGSERFLDLPTDLQATQPGSFRYVIVFGEDVRNVQSCPFGSSSNRYWLIRQRKVWFVYLVDTKTGKTAQRKDFSGSNPAACPSSHTFYSTVEYQVGGDPDQQDIIQWLRTILK